MWKMALGLAPMLMGTVTKGFGWLTGKTEANKGATAGGILGGAGLLTNPDFMNFVSDMLLKLAGFARNLPPS
jgi:hypothetical protein